ATDRLDDLDAQLAALGQGLSAPLVFTTIQTIPEELVDQVTVCGMDFDSIKSDFAGMSGRGLETGNRVGNVLVGHRLVFSLVRHHQTRRCIHLAQWLPV